MTALTTLCPGCDRPGQIRDGRNWWCVDCHRPALWHDEPEPEPRLQPGTRRTGNGLVVPHGYTGTPGTRQTTAEKGWKA